MKISFNQSAPSQLHGELHLEIHKQIEVVINTANASKVRWPKSGIHLFFGHLGHKQNDLKTQLLTYIITLKSCCCKIVREWLPIFIHSLETE